MLSNRKNNPSLWLRTELVKRRGAPRIKAGNGGFKSAGERHSAPPSDVLLFLVLFVLPALCVPHAWLLAT